MEGDVVSGATTVLETKLLFEHPKNYPNLFTDPVRTAQ
jgi:hypothetical protein